ncbi:LacI family DNA-binding transcriptional regulator [Nostocoides australiense]
MRARIADVAARSGVSTATVSLVLRDQPGPSDATRDKVRAAAAELGYRPDRTASLLARHRSHLLGVLLDVTSAFHAELVGTLDAAAERHGFDLVLSSVTPRRDEEQAVETLLDFRCEGLILIGPQLSRRQLDGIGQRAPALVLGRSGTEHVPGVRAADDLGLAAAVEHLADLDHRRIAYVDGPKGSVATARRRGYQRAMSRRGLAEAVDIIAGDHTEAGGIAAAREVLGRSASRRPTGIVCFNDRCALGLRDSLIRSGVNVPDQISLIGYDDSPPARLATVELTSVSQNPAALAEATVALLARRLDGAAPHTGSDVVVSPALVVRGSTAPHT